MNGNSKLLVSGESIMWVVELGDELAWIVQPDPTIEVISLDGDDRRLWTTLPGDTNFSQPHPYQDLLHVIIGTNAYYDNTSDIFQVRPDGSSVAITSRPVAHYSISHTADRLTFQAQRLDDVEPQIQQFDLTDGCYRESDQLAQGSQASTWSAGERIFMADDQDPDRCLYEVVTVFDTSEGGVGGAMGGETN